MIITTNNSASEIIRNHPKRLFPASVLSGLFKKPEKRRKPDEFYVAVQHKPLG